MFSAQETLEMLHKLDDRDSGSRGILTALGQHSVPVTAATGPQSAQVQRQGDEPGAQSPAINLAIQLPGRRQTTNQAFSSQDERTPWKEEEIGKDGTLWTVVGEEESRGRRQSQNALTERLIQDAQTAFLCVVDAEMLIHIHDCSVAEARRVLGDDSSSDMSVDELNAFLAVVYVREVKGGRNMELAPGEAVRDFRVLAVSLIDERAALRSDVTGFSTQGLQQNLQEMEGLMG
ncbi:hypothetical protein CRENBAI_025558 [Crenichthys baileyi]|uniref:Uncharacterized protein n=1 Tax=Crenichthys baileyi TaxID=28760 RepID=A0AAV9R973_9TELE